MHVKIDKIIRSKRKTIALQVTDDATLIVRAPKQASYQAIQKAVLKHLEWIGEKRKIILLRDPKFVQKEFVNGEGFLFLGKYYKLKIVENQPSPLIFQDNHFILAKEYLPHAKEIFIQWYKDKAYEKISERVEWYAKMRGFAYNKINITDATQRWASCSLKGNLNFSWRLIMASLRVIDYVVVHELVHLEEKSHTKFFWNKVKILMPDYEKHKEWIKRNGHILRI